MSEADEPAPPEEAHVEIHKGVTDSAPDPVQVKNFCTLSIDDSAAIAARRICVKVHP